MTPDRRAEVVRILEESGRCFGEVVAGISEERVPWNPGPDRWSVLQIVEHVAVVETGMFHMLRKAEPVENSLENPAKEALILSRAGSRENPRQAPERVHPTGRLANLPEALSHFSKARERTIRFAEETEVDLFRVTTAHPVFGPVNGYELLLIMAGHARRHANQIAEIK